MAPSQITTHRFTMADFLAMASVSRLDTIDAHSRAVCLRITSPADNFGRLLHVLYFRHFALVADREGTDNLWTMLDNECRADKVRLFRAKSGFYT
jgi:hypothetical protein